MSTPRRRLLPLLPVLLLAGACTATPGPAGSSGTPAASGPTGPTATAPVDVTAPTLDPGDGGHYRPAVDPPEFTARITNPYLPFGAGSRWVYQGVSSDGVEHDVVVVTRQHRTVMGVPVTVVRDTVSVGGEVTEDTADWYAQDSAGNVWYFGEDTKELAHGRTVSTEGSWEAGRAGALPGIVMPAQPQVGTVLRQEFQRGSAEDMMQVVASAGTAAVLGRHATAVLTTKEWSPLEPAVVELKQYAPGIGQIAERTIAGGHDHARLVAYSAGT